MPFGGKEQLTPIQAMVHKISVEKGHTDTVSLMSWGYNPYLTESSPYHGAYLAVVESCAKLVATGAEYSDVYLSFQEYFEKPMKDPKRWGKPLAALLGAFKAQMNLGVAAIGGKDSMSGSFEKIDVPPTLISFAVTTDKLENAISPEFKKCCSKVVLLSPKYDENGLDFAINEMCDIFGGMLLEGSTSFWETTKGELDFSNAGSLCHGWAAVACYVLDKYYGQK
jgi:phosphoribosylformylglycinamidine synthase